MVKKSSIVNRKAINMKLGGVEGAITDAGIEAISSFKKVYDGEKGFGEAVGDIAYAGVKGGVSSYASPAIGSAAAGATGSVIAASGIASTAAASTAVGAACIAAAPVAVGVAAGCAVVSFFSSIFDW